MKLTVYIEADCRTDGHFIWDIGSDRNEAIVSEFLINADWKIIFDNSFFGWNDCKYYLGEFRIN